jgi:hypothetical protein
LPHARADPKKGRKRPADRHTISSYRDTFRLLLQFALKRLHMQPARVAFEDIDPPLISAFLDELQNSRGMLPFAWFSTPWIQREKMCLTSDRLFFI